MSTWRGIREAVVVRLAAAGCVAAEAEADEIVAAAPDHATIERWTLRREEGEPLAWIVGSTSFCGRRVHVAPGVYEPRAQSEELARRAVAVLARGGAAADLCCGSGAIAVHLQSAVVTATVVAVDRDPRAVSCARRNGVPAIVGDVGLALRPRSFDVVTAVAPYVPTRHLRLLPADVQRYEPPGALDGGADGLEVVRRVIGSAADLLVPGGWVLVEIGGEQDRALRPTLDAHGYESVATWVDDDGDLRGLMARLGDRTPLPRW